MVSDFVPRPAQIAILKIEQRPVTSLFTDFFPVLVTSENIFRRCSLHAIDSTERKNVALKEVADKSIENS